MGEHFELYIEKACAYYRQKGIAAIQKTPEPLRPLRALGNGRFLAAFTHKAQPDFQGTLNGGQSIVFEAKHTDGEKMMQDRVTPEQLAELQNHHDRGAETFILLSFGLQDVYRVPLTDWTAMKDLFGHKFLTQADLDKHKEQYKIPFKKSIIDFLRLAE